MTSVGNRHGQEGPMIARAARTVAVGQTVSTIPNRDSGILAMTTGTVTIVERFRISSRDYVDLVMVGEDGKETAFTMSAETLVNVA